ncbi:tandem-95 repeat protein [Litorimonas sp. RW-G-Af-16]|uniref:Ig-like domain-containing protein n=1 Tax=Litorimonas sp. RW-G-Af-16 TaxID=3241168 RepID=UPI003AB03623
MSKKSQNKNINSFSPTTPKLDLGLRALEPRILLDAAGFVTGAEVAFDAIETQNVTDAMEAIFNGGPDTTSLLQSSALMNMELLSALDTSEELITQDASTTADWTADWTAEWTSETQSEFYAKAPITPIAETADAAFGKAPITPIAERLEWADIAQMAGNDDRTEIAFIDTSIGDYQTLVDAVPMGVEVILIDQSTDGLAQIAAALNGRTDVDTIHILSHGTSGALELGTATLTEASMKSEHADELNIIASALSADADILIYGCDFGANSAAVKALADATGADIAASINDTGATDLGGDWNLEIREGAIEARAFVILDFGGVLADTLDTAELVAGHSGSSSTVIGADGVTVQITTVSGDALQNDGATFGLGMGRGFTAVGVGSDYNINLSTPQSQVSITTAFHNSDSSGNEELRFVVRDSAGNDITASVTISHNDQSTVGVTAFGVSLYTGAIALYSGSNANGANSVGRTSFFSPTDNIANIEIEHYRTSGTPNGILIQEIDYAITSASATGTDTDGDSVNDDADIDDDNDGVLDVNELLLTQGTTENFENPTGTNQAISNSRRDGFDQAFPAGSGTPLSNFAGSAGFFTNANLVEGSGSASTTHLAAYEGDNYSGLHSGENFAQEVIQLELDVPVLVGQQVGLSFAAYQMTLDNVAGGFFNQPGQFEIYGIRTGSTIIEGIDGATTDPTQLNTTNSTTIAANSDVDLLGETPVISNTTEWQEYLISFTATQNYDRILIVPKSDGTNSGGPNSSDISTFLAIDAINFGLLTAVDSDGDGIDDYLDIDSDNDGITDNIEAQGTGAYTAPSGIGNAMLDADNDGLDDRYDATPNGTVDGAGSFGLNPVDTDGDDVADFRDTNSDNEGADDAVEGGTGTIATGLSSSANDLDGDGLFDVFETQGGTNSSDGFNVNESIATGAIAFPDSDGDATGVIIPLSADVDFRDATTPNVPPVLSGFPATLTVDEDGNSNFSGSILDSDSASITLVFSVDPAHGTLSGFVTNGVTITGNGTSTLTMVGSDDALQNSLEAVNFAPSADFNTSVLGTIPITITADDGVAAVVTDTISVTVNPIADIVADTLSTDDATAITFNVLTGVGNAAIDNFEGTPSVTNYTTPTSGSIMTDTAGNVTFTPTASFIGQATFDYTVTSGGVTETDTVTITIGASNAPPLAVNDIQTIVPGTPSNINLIANNGGGADGDPDGDPLFISQIIDPTNPSAPITPDFVGGTPITLASGVILTPQTDGTFNVTVPLGTPTDQSFAYQVSDGQGGFDVANVMLNLDTDGDGVANIDDIDDDNDGILDTVEAGFDPNAPVSPVTGTLGTADSFGASNAAYQVINDMASGPGQLFTLDPSTGVYVEIGTAAGFAYNNTGFDPATGFLYGIAQTAGSDALGATVSAGDLVRIDLDGETFRVGATTAADPSTIKSGDVIDGSLFIAGQDFYLVDLADGTTTTLTRTGDQREALDYSTIDGRLYGVRDNVLLVVDITGAAATQTAFSMQIPGARFGATWAATNADGDTEFYVSDNDTSNIYRIDGFDTNNPTPVLVAAGVAPTTSNDGARNPALSFVIPAPDTDGDGIADYLDIDSDNDGITDNIEAQTTAGYVAPSGTGALMTDVNGDGLDDNYSPAGLTPVNTDSGATTPDTTPDYLDTDSDNDGLNDTQEAGLGAAPMTGLSNATTDTDGDGLFDVFETQLTGNVNDGFVVNEGIAPLDGTLPDADNDASLGVPLASDLDFRDATFDAEPCLDLDTDDSHLGGTAAALTGGVEIANMSGPVTTGATTAAGQIAEWTGASVTADGMPLTLRATVVSLSTGGEVTFGLSPGGRAANTLTTGTTAEIRWEFFLEGTNTPYFGDVLPSIVDIDGDPLDPTRGEIVTVSTEGLIGYAVDSATTLDITNFGDRIEFAGTQISGGADPEAQFQIGYRDVSGFTLTYEYNGGGGTFALLSRETVTLSDVTLVSPDKGYADTFTEGDAPITVADDVSITDSAFSDFPELTIRLNNISDGANEVFTLGGEDFEAGVAETASVILTSGATAVVVFDGSQFSITGTGGALLSDGDLTDLVQAITYENKSEDPTAADRNLIFNLDNSINISPDAVSTITVIPVNEIDAMDDGPVSVIGGTSTPIDVVGDNDFDEENDPLTITEIIDPADAANPIAITAAGQTVTLTSGTIVVVNGDGTVNVTTLATFTGTDTFQYTISDGIDTDSATVTLNSDGNNDPVAENNINEVTEDVAAPATGNVITDNDPTNGLDSDLDSDPLIVSGIDGNTVVSGTPTIVIGTYGTLTINTDGSYSYALDNTDAAVQGLGVTESLNETFTYTASDGQGGTDTANLVITINGVNDVIIPEIPGDPTVPTDRTDFIPPQTGIDNLAPAALDLNIYFNDPDTTDTLTFTATPSDLPPGLTLVNGIISGTLDNSASQGGTGGVYTIPVTVTDSNGDSFVTQVEYTVTNPAPIAQNDMETTDANATLSESVLTDNSNGLDIDPDGDALTVTQVNGMAIASGGQITLPSGALLTMNSDGTYDYNPNGVYDALALGETATDSFGYVIDDGEDGTSNAVVTITIDGVNEPIIPQIPGDPNLPVDRTDFIPDQTGVDSELSTPLDISRFFTDPDTTDVITLTIAPVDLPAGLIFDGTSISGTPAADASQGGVNGVYTINVGVTDNNGDSFVSQFTYTITNPIPTAQDDVFTVTEDAPALTGNLITADNGNGTDTDPDGDALIIAEVNSDAANLGTPIAGSTGGLFTVSPDGSYSFDPNGEFEALAVGETAITSLTYLVSDGEGGTDLAMVTVTIEGVNDAPIPVDPEQPTGPITPGDPTDPDDPRVPPVDPQDYIPAQIGDDSSPVPPLDLTPYFGDPDAGDIVTLSITPSDLPSGLTFDGTTIFGTPDPDASQGGVSGVYDIPVTATDPNGASFTTIVTYTISNPAPIAVDDVEVTDEDTVLSDTVLVDNGSGVDSDPDGDTLVVTEVNGTAITSGNVITLPSGALLTMNSNGSYDYDPNGQYEGLAVGETATDSFTYLISDGEGGTDLATVTVTVEGVNDAPIPVDPEQPTGPITPGDPTDPDDPRIPPVDPQDYIPAQIGDDGSPVPLLDLTPYFGDPDAGDIVTLSITPSDLPPGLTFDGTTISGTLDPDASQGGVSGVYDIPVTATDPSGASFTTIVTYTISNPAPVAVNDSYTVVEDTPLSVNILTENDSDPDGDTLVIDAVALPDGTVIPVGVATLIPEGTLTVNSDGSTTFSPRLNYFGPVTFGYTISDGEGGTDVATVTIDVTPVNDTPIPVDPEQPELTPQNPDVPVDPEDPHNPPIDPQDYIPGQVGLDDAPVPPLYLTPYFGDPDLMEPITITVGDLPPGLSFDPVTGIISGTLDPSASQGGDPNNPGVYEVLVTATDPSGESFTTVVTYTVENPAPIATDDGILPAVEDTPLTLDLLSNDTDPDGDALIITEINGTPITVGLPTILPSGASVTLNLDGTVAYDPAPNANGLESFTYTINDGEGGTDMATVTLDIAPVNDTPIVTSDDPETPALPPRTYLDGQTIPPLDVATPFTDIENSPLVFTSEGLPEGLTIDPVTGVISGTIDKSASVDGPYPVTITATDPEGESVSTSFLLTVLNPAPIIAPIDVPIPVAGEPIEINVGDVTNDPDDDSVLTYSAPDLPPGLTIDPITGKITGSPTVPQNTPYVFEVVVDDGEGGIARTTISLQVNEDGFVDIQTPDNDSQMGGDVDPYEFLEGQPIDLQRYFRDRAIDNRDDYGRMFGDRDFRGGMVASYVPGMGHDCAYLVIEAVAYDHNINVQLGSTLPMFCGTDVRSWDVTLSNGGALPEWVNWSNGGDHIEIQRPLDQDTISLRVRALLDNGRTAISQVTIDLRTGTVIETGEGNLVAQTLSDQLMLEQRQIAANNSDLYEALAS